MGVHIKVGGGSDLGHPPIMIVGIPSILTLRTFGSYLHILLSSLGRMALNTDRECDKAYGN